MILFNFFYQILWYPKYPNAIIIESKQRYGNINNHDSMDVIIPNHLSLTKYQNDWAASTENSLQYGCFYEYFRSCTYTAVYRCLNDCSNSSALATELLQSCAKQSMCSKCLRKFMIDLTCCIPEKVFQCLGSVYAYIFYLLIFTSKIVFYFPQVPMHSLFL